MMNCLKRLLPLVLVDLIKTQIINNKITENEGKIPSITGLVTAAALTDVENKIPNFGDLVKRDRL